VPLVSISHADGSAVAALSDGDGVAGVGIDLERCGRMKPGMEKFAFSAGERETLQAFTGDERDTWALRLWCAKEACAKATGMGAAGGLHAFSVLEMHPERGTVSIRCRGAGGRLEDLVALTAQEGDWIVATCAAAAGVFVHETIT
jgi:phosphopantetheinyl transferase